MRNFCIYTLPEESCTIGFESDNALIITDLDNLDEILQSLTSGFIIAPFDIKRHPIVIIPSQRQIKFSANALKYTPAHIHTPVFFPARSTTLSEHSKEVEAAINSICSIKDYPEEKTKIVAARTLLLENNVDLSKIIENLPGLPKNCFRFCFYTRSTGLWVGASPEVLLSSDGYQIHTMALAGTRPHIDDDPEGNRPWDRKNILEQQAVTDFIKDQLNQSCNDVRLSTPATRKAGKIEHIITQISASLPQNKSKGLPGEGAASVFSKIIKLALRLSPTPALSGNPRDMAIEFINTHEHFDRAYYGGFCGPFIKDNNSLKINLFVNLRSGIITGGKTALYAGGGITMHSDATAEWDETERKLSTLSSLLYS
ncbi:MAG: chorismate-binding protein [Muribaculum sp.]|nr:chorismate-binding protein [Muribaculum sp.]